MVASGFGTDELFLSNFPLAKRCLKSLLKSRRPENEVKTALYPLRPLGHYHYSVQWLE